MFTSLWSWHLYPVNFWKDFFLVSYLTYTDICISLKYGTTLYCATRTRRVIECFLFMASTCLRPDHHKNVLIISLSCIDQLDLFWLEYEWIRFMMYIFLLFNSQCLSSQCYDCNHIYDYWASIWLINANIMSKALFNLIA